MIFLNLFNPLPSVITPDAWIMVLVGYLVVFVALLLIYLFFRYLIPFFFSINLRRRSKKTGEVPASLKSLQISGEVNAAIAMALYLYMEEQHDDESNVITIKRVSKIYSPWSSKLYNMRNFPK